MPKPLKEKGLGELQTFLNRTSRAYSRGKISLKDFSALQGQTSALIELLRAIEEADDSEGEPNGS